MANPLPYGEVLMAPDLADADVADMLEYVNRKGWVLLVNGTEATPEQYREFVEGLARRRPAMLIEGERHDG